MSSYQYKDGVKASLPVVMGYIPIGLAFGVLAVQAGLGPWEVFLMSLLVYAGSSQFIAAGMIAGGASPGSIIITTFLVNSRHLLLSASLAPHLKGRPGKTLAAISFGITDETFAVAMAEVVKNSRPPAYFAGLNITSQFFWIASTVMGAVVGNLIPDPGRFGLNFALPAMFIGLLVIQIRGRLGLAIAVLAFAMSLLFKAMLPGNWNIILTAVLAATIGVILEKWLVKSTRSLSA